MTRAYDYFYIDGCWVKPQGRQTLDEKTRLGPVVSEAQFNKINRLIQQGFGEFLETKAVMGYGSATRSPCPPMIRPGIAIAMAEDPDGNWVASMNIPAPWARWQDTGMVS